jgi:hypothetical protein
MPANDEKLSAGLGTGDPAVLAIHCSDAGAQAAFYDVLKRKHGNSIVESVAIPGGAWWLARVASATRSGPRRWLAGKVAGPVEDAIERALARRTLQAVELLGHEGCGWYELVVRNASAGELVRRQGEDLFVAAEELARWSRLPVAGRIVLGGSDGATVRTLFG